VFFIVGTRYWKRCAIYKWQSRIKWSKQDKLLFWYWKCLDMCVVFILDSDMCIFFSFFGYLHWYV